MTDATKGATITALATHDLQMDITEVSFRELREEKSDVNHWDYISNGGKRKTSKAQRTAWTTEEA